MTASISVSMSPYPGLRPFRRDESDLFFGRGTQVADMLRRLETHRFLAVVEVRISPNGANRKQKPK